MKNNLKVVFTILDLLKKCLIDDGEIELSFRVEALITIMEDLETSLADYEANFNHSIFDENKDVLIEEIENNYHIFSLTESALSLVKSIEHQLADNRDLLFKIETCHEFIKNIKDQFDHFLKSEDVLSLEQDGEKLHH